MKFYPFGQTIDFSLRAVSSSYAVSSSFVLSPVDTASFALQPTGPTGGSGSIYLLSSNIGVCATTTTTTTTLPPTTTTTTTTTSTTTTTTTTAAPVCGGPCGVGFDPCAVGCFCNNGGDPSAIGTCVQGEPS